MTLANQHDLDSFVPSKKVKIVIVLPELVDESLKEEISTRMDQFCKEIERLIDEKSGERRIGG